METTGTTAQTFITPGAYTRETIGTVTFTEQSEPRHENHTSYAADHQTYTILPGTYETQLVRRGDAASQAYVTVTVDIEITNETVHSGFGGVNFATDSNNTVRKSTKTYQIYDYEAARTATNPRPNLFDGGDFKLNPGWHVLTNHHTFKDGHHYTSNKFAHLA